MTLRLRGIGKAYGGRAVLRGIDLDVAPGQAAAILGANGSGKSTLLRIAAAVTAPDQGQVEVAGEDAFRRGRDEATLRRRIAFVGQEGTPYGDLTPAEHLRWWGRMQGLPDAGTQGTHPVAQTLAEAGLAAAAHKPAVALSRGQRQRLLLAAALRAPPPLLVLDEPFTALDAAGEAWLCGRLEQALRDGSALLLAVHDATQAGRVAASTWRIRERRLEAA